MRACVRGRGYRKFVYHPDRLKYPMKRVGKRGEGKFERISWDEATTLIADNLKRITQQYGPASRYVHVGTAVSGGTFSGDAMARRLLNLTGGYLEYYHSVSLGNTAAATPYTYGVAASGNSMDTLLDTKLVILWGHNPTETIFGHTNYFFKNEAKRYAFYRGRSALFRHCIFACRSVDPAAADHGQCVDGRDDVRHYQRESPR